MILPDSFDELSDLPTSTGQPVDRPGEVRDAILQAFADSGGPLSVEEVRAAVSIQLGAVVAASSVRSYLNINAEPGQTFERVGRGIYRLRK